MYCISLDYRNAECESRSAFSLTKSKVLSLANSVGGSVVALFTCNRSEIYFTCQPSKILNQLKLLGITDKRVYDNLILYCNGEVVYHLFEVVCGLQSAVLGEDDIIRQVKKAYYFSLQNKMTDADFNLLFQKAFNCAKRVKSTTALSKSATSYATLCTNCAKDFIRQKNLDGNVLLVGATGDLGSVIAKNILSCNLTLTATSRHCGGEKTGEFNTIDYKRRYDYIAESDVIITATSSPHLIFDYDFCSELINENKLFIDLSVPSDIDRRIGNSAKLVNIDYFSKTAQQNNRIKLQAAQTARQIIQYEAQEYFEIMRKREERLNNALFSRIC